MGNCPANNPSNEAFEASDPRAGWWDMGGVRLMVLPKGESWRIRVGDKLSRPRDEAVRSAFDNAKALAREGLESEVVMTVLTCRFGPDGFFKAFPTPLHTPNDEG